MQEQEKPITMSLDQLKWLFEQQKQIVIERLLGSKSYYNAANTPGHQFSLDIDEEKFKEIGFKSRYPGDYEVLIKYLKKP